MDEQLCTSVFKMQEAKIQKNAKCLNQKAAETTDIMNQLANAALTIKKLKAELAQFNHYSTSHRHRAGTLCLQANKLEQHKVGILQMYEKAASEIDSRIKQKEHEISEGKLRWKKLLKLQDEAKKENENFKAQLRKMDSKLTVLKSKLANQASWNVRTLIRRSKQDDK